VFQIAASQFLQRRWICPPAFNWIFFCPISSNLHHEKMKEAKTDRMDIRENTSYPVDRKIGALFVSPGDFASHLPIEKSKFPII
jgi:hypothetical protein